MSILECDKGVANKHKKPIKELRKLGKGITNNAVEFLVQLGIDEQKSKIAIDRYLEKISKKTIKLTYSVNVGVSNKNIRDYLDKHNGKVLKVDIDVNRASSKKNLDTFLSSYKDKKVNITLDIDKVKTERNIRTTLSSIATKNIVTTVAVDKVKSRTNINNFLKEVKTTQPLVTLGVNKKLSKENINTYITTLTPSKVAVALTLAKNGLEDVKNKTSDLKIGKIKTVLELDVTQTKVRIQEQINNMKLPRFKVDVIANVVPNVSKTAQAQVQNISQTPKQTSNATTNKDELNKNKPKDTAMNLTGYVGTVKQVKEQIKKEFAEAGKAVKIFEGDIHKAQKSFISQLEKDGAKLSIVRDSQTKEISKITATTRNSANEIVSTIYKPLIATYDNANKKIKEGSKSVRGFVAEVDKVNSKEFFDMDKEITKINNKLTQAKHKGHIFTGQINTLTDALSKAGNNNDFNKINRQLDEYIRDNKNALELDRMRNATFKQREQVLSSITRTEKLYRRTHDKDVAQGLKATVNSASQKDVFKMDVNALREYNKQLLITSTQATKFHAQATEATKNSMGIINSLKVAMEKFPIWMVASTAFYGTIRTMREFGTIIIDIDKKMTDLKKVMSEDTNFDKIFEQATLSAETFGKTLSETMDAYIMFAKQGYKGDELQTLANAGLVAGNVGDIEAGKASEYLTASLLQWNRESSEAMGIVDSWNEISNNYATTVENLAQGQAKAGATAKALGMDFDQLNAVVGTLNARTKQSGNEIGNFVKSTFSNIISNKGRGVLANLGVGLENEDGSLRDIMDIYKDVAKEYVKLNQADKNSVTLGLAGKYHISRMQTLLDDLGSAESMYDSMYDTSQNSANSAINENQKYMQSFEARINLARVEIEKLALALGEAFLTEGMIAGLQMFSSMIGSVAKLVETLGALPIVFISIIGLLTVFSNRFNDIIAKTSTWTSKMTNTVMGRSPVVGGTDGGNSSLKENTKETKDNTSAKAGATTVIAGQTDSVKKDTDATDKNTASKKKGAKALSLFSAGFGAVGAIALVAGFGLEFLFKKMQQNREEQEAITNAREKDIQTYKTSEKSISKLAERYKELSAVNHAPDSEGYTELLEVQNELAKLLPSLKIGEDEYGNAILQNSNIVSGRVDLLKQQVDLEKELADIKASEENEETIEKAEKDYKKQSKRVDVEAGNASAIMGKAYYAMPLKKIDVNPFQDIESAEQLLGIIKEIDGKLKDQKFLKGAKISESEVDDLKSVRGLLTDTFEKMNIASLEVQTNLSILRTSSEKDLNDILQGAEDMGDGAVQSFNNVANSALSLADTKGSVEDVATAFKGIQIDTDMQGAFAQLHETENALKSETNTNLDEVKAKYSGTFDEIRKTILDSYNLEPNSGAYKAIAEALDIAENSAYDYQHQVATVAKETGKTTEEAQALIAKLGDTENAIDGATDSLEDYVKSLQNYSTLEEQRLGYTDAQIQETKSLINTYEGLVNVTDRTASEQTMLDTAMQRLIAIYPHLISQSNFRVDALYSEIDTADVLMQAHQNLTDDMLTEEEERSYNSALGANERIKIIQKEMMAMDSTYQSYRATYDKLMKKHNSGETLTDSEGRGLMQMSHLISEYESNATLLDEYMTDLNGNLDTLSKANERVTGSTKESNAETERATKIAEKYALSLEKINTQLSEIERLKKKYATHSSNYRKALLEENKLLQQQLDINSQQASELASGVGVGGVGGGGFSSTNILAPSGFQGAITSKYNEQESFRKNPHTGIDIAGSRGTPLQSNVKGQVVASGTNALSGNYVAVMDSNGMRHFYAHLDSIAVSVDDLVDVGTKLGAIGNTGSVQTSGNKANGAGSHLHYEVKNSKTGKNVDPTHYVDSAKNGINYNINISSSSPSASSGNSNQASIWNFFKEKGLNEKAIAGIMGNLQQESNFDSNAGKNAPNNAYGLAQWRGERREGLNTYASSLGKSANDLQVQLDYIWKELNSTEKSTLNSLQTSKSVAEHASSFDNLFERSGGSEVGKRQNYANQIYNSSQSGGLGGDSQLSEIERLKQNGQDIASKIEETQFLIYQSHLEEYEYKRGLEENIIQQQDIAKSNLQSYTKEYQNAVKKQIGAESNKRKLFNDELYFVNQILKSGKLNEAQTFEMLDVQAKLTQEIKESEQAIRAYNSEVVQSSLDGFEKDNQRQQDILDWETVKIQSVDKESKRYIKTLEIMNNARSKQYQNIQAEQKYVDQMLRSGNLTIEMYTELTERAKNLKNTAIEALMAIRQANLEMIQANVSVSNEQIDDYDYNISRSQSIRGLYDEKSGDALKELNYELEQHRLKLEAIRSQGDVIRFDMSSKDLGHAELEQLEEQLEDNNLAWYATKEAIQSTEEAIKSFNESIDDEISNMRESMADEVIYALQNAYGEMRDIKISAIEDEIEVENERHEKVMEQYEDELDMFNKIIDAKRRELSDSDRDRTHNMGMDELVKERQELQNKANQLANVNTYAGKKEREELEKQITEVNKKIQEEEYQYSKELREQALDDELTEREDQISELQELETENFDKNIELLDSEKAYWEKHFEDLINDERRFHELRETLTKGSNAQIEAEMAKLKLEIGQHITDLKISLPSLADTLNGTMEAVGMNIRDNVIFELENLLKMIDKVNNDISDLENKKNNITNEFGNSFDIRDDNMTHATDKENGLTENDLKVLLAKFAREKITESLNPETDKAYIDGIRTKTDNLAKEARTGKNASSISNTHSYDEIVSTFSQGQMAQVGQYFQQNAGSLGFDTSSFTKFIENYGSGYTQQKTLSDGDKKVLLAKYMQESLKTKATTQSTKDDINNKANTLAQDGRSNTSLIVPTINYETAIKGLGGSQLYELGYYMKNNAGLITDGALRSQLEEYAERMILSSTRQHGAVGLDSGGMTASWGSTGGMDGKGGKFALLHQNEVVSNPLDTSRMLQISQVLEKIMKSIGGAIRLPKAPSLPSVGGAGDNSTHIHISIDKMTGTQSDIDNLGRQIQNKLLREKGKR